MADLLIIVEIRPEQTRPASEVCEMNETVVCMRTVARRESTVGARLCTHGWCGCPWTIVLKPRSRPADTVRRSRTTTVASSRQSSTRVALQNIKATKDDSLGESSKRLVAETERLIDKDGRLIVDTITRETR
jgi:galactokinase